MSIGMHFLYNNGFPLKPFTLIIQNGYTQRALFVTRYRQGQRPPWVDLVITNDHQLIGNVNYIVLLWLSEHYVLKIEFVCHWTYSSDTRPLCRCFRKAKFAKIRDHLSEQIDHLDTHDPDFYDRLSKTNNFTYTLFVPRVNRHNYMIWKQIYYLNVSMLNREEGLTTSKPCDVAATLKSYFCSNTR